MSGKIAGHVRLEMLERGFVLLETPRFVDNTLAARCTGAMGVHCKQWRTFPQLARYGFWLETLLRRALPEESLSLSSLEFRNEPDGFEDHEVDRLHADGSYIRSVCTLRGLATIYRDQKVEQSAPVGHTLLMTAMDRARAVRVPCTLHRRPGAGPQRAVIVCSFEPCDENSGLPNIFHQVAVR